MKISVIIPTYNRKIRLLNALFWLSKQSIGKKNYEVIIVNDGGNLDLKDYKFNMNLKFLTQKRSGTSKARNLGVRNAKGDLIVFIGDDILCPKDFLKNHLKAHKTPNVVVSGSQIWVEKPNDYMNMLINNKSLMEKSESNVAIFCTANVSVERKILEENKFNEDFEMEYEDMELGYRLLKNGIKMRYDDSVYIYHDHYYNLNSFEKKIKQRGKSAVILVKNHPELKKDVIPSFIFIKYILCKVLILFKPFTSNMFHTKLIYFINYTKKISKRS